MRVSWRNTRRADDARLVAADLATTLADLYRRRTVDRRRHAHERADLIYAAEDAVRRSFPGLPKIARRLTRRGPARSAARCRDRVPWCPGPLPVARHSAA